MYYIYNILAFIFCVIGKLLAKCILLLCSTIRYLNKVRITNANDGFDKLINENNSLKIELKKYKQANSINLQRIHKLHSCFCERLKIIIFKLTHHTQGKDLEDLFGYSHRTISSWLCLRVLERFGLMGIFPKGELPHATHGTAKSLP